MDGGGLLGSVAETSYLQTRVLVPPGRSGVIEWHAQPGEYRVDLKAVYTGTSGELYLGSMTWGGVVMTPDGVVYGNVALRILEGAEFPVFVPSQPSAHPTYRTPARPRRPRCARLRAEP